MSHTQLPRVTKIVVCLIFTKFKKLEPIFIIYDTLYAEGPNFLMHA